METSPLSTALDKFNGGESERVPSLTSDEVQALKTYLKDKGDAPSHPPSEQSLMGRIRAAVEAANGDGGKSSFHRTNNALRTAIDLFLVKDFPNAKEGDLRILQETQIKLRQMGDGAEPSPNQVRLLQLIERCLENYSEWSGAQATAESPASAAAEPSQERVSTPPLPAESSGAITLDAASLNTMAGPREPLNEIEEVPHTAFVRRIEHRGDLSVVGDCEEGLFIRVHDGGVRVKGAVSCIIVADGDIVVSGNLQGGWLLSRRGSISVARVLSNSRLIAPVANVSAAALEHPALLYCGGTASVTGDVLGTTVYAGSLLVGETVRHSAIQLLDRLEAHTMESSPREPTTVNFCAALLSDDYGRAAIENVEPALRHLARAHVRRRVVPALVAFYREERLNICRTRLFVLRVGREGVSTARALRDGHAVYATLELIVTLSEAIKDMFALGERLGDELLSTLIKGVLDEATGFVNTILKETVSMSQEYVADVSMLDAPCRQVLNLGKKLPDGLRLKTGVPKLLYDFDIRLDEWRKAAEKGRMHSTESLSRVADVLGETVFAVTECATLEALAGRLEAQAGEGGMRGPELSVLKTKSTEYGAHESHWEAIAAAEAGTYASTLEQVTRATEMVLASEGERGMVVGKMARDIPVRTLQICRKISGRNGTAAVLSVEKENFTLTCTHHRLYGDAIGGEPTDAF